MCALEELRRRRPKLLGSTRFSVGLWVGRSASANRLQDVATTLNDHSHGGVESPFPLTSCPWCFSDIAIRDIKLVDDAGTPSRTKYTRAAVYCKDSACPFTERNRPGEGLPVLFVDEQIYREVPEFIVATVDKFAMVPWRGETGMLFGRASAIDERRAYGVMDKAPKQVTPLPEGLRPPELIVQDEMHLISGPLGTMVGLYETAIDRLCTREVDGRMQVPKVVCSTATVRRAREQIRALFHREMEVFPPRGPNHGDNFFSTLNEDAPGRLYVGVAAPGRALRKIAVGTYATLHAAATKHFDQTGEPKQPADPYMTLVGYFNSLRELGGMRRLVEDEVANRLRRFAEERRPEEWRRSHPWAANRRLNEPAELTSRESTARVKETKARLAIRHARPASGDEREGLVALDTVLASNMISVGLDVDRLGLMVVVGQPKTTSEYIQATSRVGRAYPGLVVTCLNTIRPRDRSHFERFVAYHQSFYREVEATSVTPFSLQTLDRAMAATLVSMIRHGIAPLEPPAGFMELHEHRAAAEAMLQEFVERGRAHREWADETAENRAENELHDRGKNFLDAWEKIVDAARDGAASRIYSGLDGAKDIGKPVMHTALDPPPDSPYEKRFQAPTSMRDVEPSTHLWLSKRHLDERRQ